MERFYFSISKNQTLKSMVPIETNSFLHFFRNEMVRHIQRIFLFEESCGSIPLLCVSKNQTLKSSQLLSFYYIPFVISTKHVLSSASPATTEHLQPNLPQGRRTEEAFSGVLLDGDRKV